MGAEGEGGGDGVVRAVVGGGDVLEEDGEVGSGWVGGWERVGDFECGGEMGGREGLEAVRGGVGGSD